MKPLRLYSGPKSMFGMKAHIAALEKGLDVELVMVSYSDERGYDPKHPDVLRINPKQQVPVLVHGDLEIFDSTQIFEYLEDLAPKPALWPPSPAHRARARLLEHKSDEVYFPHIIRLMGLQDAMKTDAAAISVAAASSYYLDMEQQLENRSFLAGSFSYADIAFYMAQVFGERMGAVMTLATPRLMTWRDSVSDRPSVKQALQPMIDFLVNNQNPVPGFLNK
jgi:glutathione S-transferase